MKLRSRNRPPARRLLVVSHTHPRLTQGGAEIAAYELYRQALAAGEEAWFLAANGGSYASRTGAALQQPWGEREFLYVHRGGDEFRFSNPDPAWETEFGALLQRLAPTVIHFHHYLGIGMESFAYASRYAPEAETVLTLHEYLAICAHFGQMVTRPDLHLCYAASPTACHRCFPDRDRTSFFLRELWVKRFLREIDRFESPSEFLRTRYIEWGLPAERIAVRPNPVPQREPPPRQNSTPSTSLRVAFFGQLSRLKGIDVFLRAARLLEQRAPEIELRIYGSAENQPLSFQEWIRNAFADLPSNVVLKGRYRNEDVLARMAENDVVVVPSIWWENAPLVIDEARAAGCIVVGTDIGGVREGIAKRPTDRLFGHNDPADLARVLQRLAGDRCPSPR